MFNSGGRWGSSMKRIEYENECEHKAKGRKHRNTQGGID